MKFIKLHARGENGAPGQVFYLREDTILALLVPSRREDGINCHVYIRDNEYFSVSETPTEVFMLIQEAQK